MYEKWLRALRKVTVLREARFRELLNELCGRALAVVLFGSRARGDHTPLSDWDLLAITPSGEYKLEVVDVGQVAWLPLDRLDEVLERSMIILDAVADGKVLCGDPQAFNVVKEKVEKYIRERGLVRTKSGWYPRRAVGLVD
ncbi:MULTISPECIES: nucleotidyltransferase domain-containing protein [Pyrobaculum]|uniref:DNA polymerase, beta domain protein region n=2 Tax=Pyrobaculum arsenaticum TaxID=121277 RepID=A4WJ40_PYRAR|nr:nucleotidyltransferase domain-containing protein [Pyrobaculum arsenaticum]ABP50407.1 DNA polymerase, beta domain protein region [Pyrobaculum arsenaticum DSM 13514]MCY0890395.1 nucleotidyltransferase domain-containing protein [Pyrobaculum arsenaticum]NYR14649.1 nucleotidyltransferase domain-containing protein [Pyrobaculum arsenaticum]